MILCMMCGKVDTYRLTAHTVKDMYFNEVGECVGEKSARTVYPRMNEQSPRCPNCGRVVKIFKNDFCD